MQLTAQEISLYLNGTLEGNPQTIIQRPARIEEASVKILNRKNRLIRHLFV